VATELVYAIGKNINAEYGVSGSHISHNFENEYNNLIANEVKKRKA